MSLTCVSLLFWVLCWGFPSLHTILSHAAVYHVTPLTPNPNSPHGGVPCFTLNEYSRGNYFAGDDNITLLFLNGEHNLTAHDFEITNKMFLAMAPIDEQPEVLIQLVNTSIIVQNVKEVELSMIKLVSTREDSHTTHVQSCFFLTGNSFMAIAGVSINSCKLSLLGEITAAITELAATESTLYLGLKLNNHTVFISNSSFYFSTLNISDVDMLANKSCHNETKTSVLSIQSSLVNNSLVTVSLAHSAYKLLIVDTSITDNELFTFHSTAIIVETFRTGTINVLNIQHCSIIGYLNGLVMYANGENNLVELTVDQCYIQNGFIAVVQGGRYFAGFNSSTVTITSITSTTLVNTPITFIRHSGEAAITVFNSTFRSNLKNDLDFFFYHEVYFDNIGTDTSDMVINLNQNVFEGDREAVEWFYAPVAVLFEGTRSSRSIINIENCLFTHFQYSAIEFYDTSAAVMVTNSTFAHNRNGITMISFSNSSIIIKNSIFLENDEISIDVFTFQDDLYKIITNTFNITNCLFTQGYSAMEFDGTLATLMIINSFFLRNRNGILVKSGDLLMAIEGSIFKENKGISLGAERLQSDNAKHSYITLRNATFFNNSNFLRGIIQVDGSISLSIEDSCVFKQNFGSSIQAFLTTVNLSGEVIFEDNIALQGGAISLRLSKLILRRSDNFQTNISFINNTALVTGGGIFIAQSSPDSTDTYFTGSGCFYEVETLRYFPSYNEYLLVTLYFRDNKATFGGLDIYGATPNSRCLVSKNRGFSYSVQKYIFDTSSSLSSISSDPKRVCLCDSLSQLQCANSSYIFYTTERYRGEKFTISAAVVGFEFGTVTGQVYANFLKQSPNSTLGAGQHLRQTFYEQCTPLDFSVFSNHSTETIVLTSNSTLITEQVNVSGSLDITQGIPFELLTLPVYISIRLLDCPPGFKIADHQMGQCECSESIKKIGITNCSINDHVPYITRSGNQWIQPVMNHTLSSIVISEYCPLSYCKQELVALNMLEDSDQQCALNHTGILCGGCPPDLSLAIGSSNCMECSNNYGLLLLLAFAAAGILLVLLIKILDMTVAVGTINGLLFYANIIWANQRVLFPPHTQRSSLLLVLKVFIAWLNLDFGIETCFIQHLNGYWKTWLQLAFPAYIWLIAGVIILASHYSVRVTKLLGSNSLSVLGTLFLFSYAKLLRTLLFIFEFTFLDFPDGTRVVWSFDGNVPYFSVKHIIMLLVGIFILLVLWLPYTFVLLFIPCLRRYSHYKALKWVNKVNPLFDSYLGALKAKHQYWIGLGLLARLVLLVTSTIASITVPIMAVLIIIFIASLFCLLVSNVYLQWQLGVLEGCFLVNMAVFSSGVLFVETQEGSKDILACTSLGIAFILFLVIVVHLVWRKVQSLRRNRRQENEAESNRAPLHDTTQRNIMLTTFQEISIPELRETLLESVAS